LRKTKQPRTHHECRIMLACDESASDTTTVEWGQDYPRAHRGDNAGRWGRQQRRAYLNLLKAEFIEVVKTEEVRPAYRRIMASTSTRMTVQKTASWERWKKYYLARRQEHFEWLEAKAAAGGTLTVKMGTELERFRRDGVTWLPAKIFQLFSA
jgi:hypothetical protein